MSGVSAKAGVMKALVRNRAVQISGGGLLAALVIVNTLGGGAIDELEFKGLTLGMPIEKAAAVLAEHGLPAQTKPDGSLYYEDFLGRKTVQLAQGLVAVWTLYADEQYNVDEIFLSPGAVNKLFNATDLTGEEFAQSFIGAYGVPKLEPLMQEAGFIEQAIGDKMYDFAWEYIDLEHGWRLLIAEDKQLKLKRTATTVEMKFD